MYAKGHIRHHACLRPSARNLPCHVLAAVDQRRQQVRIRAQRYRETHEDQRWAAGAARRRRLLPEHSYYTYLRLHNACINGMPHLPLPYAVSVGA